MDELESRLRSLPLRRPSPGLDDRVFGSARPAGAGAERQAGRSPARVPLWSAAAAAILMGLLGYGLRWLTAPAAAERRPALPIVTTEIIVRPAADAMPFDFTRPSDPWLEGPLQAELVHVKGA